MWSKLYVVSFIRKVKKWTWTPYLPCSINRNNQCIRNQKQVVSNTWGLFKSLFQWLLLALRDKGHMLSIAGWAVYNFQLWESKGYTN